MQLWADGFTYSQITKIVGISSWRTVENWKKAKTPCCWDKYTEEVRKKRVDEIKNESFDCYKKTITKQHKVLNKLLNQSYDELLQRLENDEINTDDVIKLFIWSIKAQRSLYLDPQEALELFKKEIKVL